MRTLSVIGTAAAVLMATAGQTSAQSGVRVLKSGRSSGAVTITGNGLVQAGPMAVNSSSSSAVTGTGNGVLECTSVSVVGNASFSGNFSCTSAVVNNATAVADPCASVAIPESNTCHPDDFSTSGTVTMSPGTYGSISITGQAKVTMSPGTYIITEGMMVSGHAEITGQGVTLVLEDGALSLSGQSAVTLTPPTSGTLAGMTIAQPGSNSSTMTLTGGSELSITGTIYAPAAQMQLSGNGDTTGTGPLFGEMVVVSTLNLSGNGVLRIGQAQSPNTPSEPPTEISAPPVSAQFD